MIVAFADIERALQSGVAFRIFVDGGHTSLLNEVHRVFFAFRMTDAKEDSKQVLGTRQFFKRDHHVVAGVKFQIEPKYGFDGGDGAAQVFAWLARFQHGHIRIDDPERASWTGDEGALAGTYATRGEEADEQPSPSDHGTRAACTAALQFKQGVVQPEETTLATGFHRPKPRQEPSTSVV